VIDTEMPEVVMLDPAPPRPRRRQPAPVRSTSVVLPVAGLIAFVGLVGVGFLLASRRRAPVAPLLSTLPSLHVPSFDLHWIGRLAVVSAAQAAISHVVQSAMRTWR
jgi:hypothetical protein